MMETISRQHLEKQLADIKSYIKAKKNFVTSEMWNRKISQVPDLRLTDKVIKATIEFCCLGYMDSKTFESLKPLIKNPALLDFMKKSIIDDE